MPIGVKIDELATRIGHKRLFGITTLFSLQAYYCLFHPPAQLIPGPASLPSSNNVSIATCDVLRSTLENLVQKPPDHHEEQPDLLAAPKPFTLALWLLCCRLATQTICVNLILLPVPSLVYRINVSNANRTKYYATESMVKSMGLLIAGLCATVFAYISGSDIQLQANVLYATLATLHLICFILLLSARFPTALQGKCQNREEQMRIIPTARTLLHLLPFRHILFITVATHTGLLLRSVTMMVAVNQSYGSRTRN